MRAYRIVLAIVAAALCAVLFFLARSKGVATDIYSLAGCADTLIGEYALKSADTIRVLCTDEERADKCTAAAPGVLNRASPDIQRLLDWFLAHRKGLLAEKSRKLLENGDYQRIKRSTLRRDYSGFGLFPKDADPSYFLSDYVAGLKDLMPKALGDGAVLLTGDISAARGAQANGRDALKAALAGLIALAREDDGIYLGGAPFHAYIATEKSKSEINALGFLSLAVAAALGWMLFHNLRFVLPMSLAITFGFLAGSAATFSVFPKPHILTFLFSTTLVGLGVDYCYHALAEAGSRTLRRDMTLALATTLLAFAPLLFSEVEVLRQMAVFTIAGLAAMYAAASCMGASVSLGAGAEKCAFPDLSRRPFNVVAIPLAASALIGASLVDVSTDPAAFYSPDPLLARGEAKVADALGGASRSFVAIEAPTVEEALQREEACALKGLSALVPSMKRQKENAQLVARFTGEEPRGGFVTVESLPESLRAFAEAMMIRRESGVVLIAEKPQDRADGETQGECSGMRELNPRADLETMFARLTANAEVLLAVSFAIMLAALAVLFRRRFWAYAMPLAFGVVMTLALFALLGVKVTLFHLVALFVACGIGIDYVIFHKSAGGEAPVTRKVVAMSFLTSLAGFGALGFTTFPPTRAIGITLATALAFVYFLSLPCDVATRERQPWHKQREKGATRLGILIIWQIYRIFGKTAAKVVFLAPLAFIAPLCRGVSWRKLLNFAWSRIDIVDAVTLRKSPPRFRFSGDTGWLDGGAFLISSHLGAIEVLAALCGEGKRAMHAFQQLSHDPVFTSFLTERMNGFTLHDVADVGVETASEMSDALKRGELVLMAGDRLSARSASGGGRRREPLVRPFLGSPREWPRGVFRFAKLLECPVYAIIATKDGRGAYEVKARLLSGDLVTDYAAFLSSEAVSRPDEWYEF